MEKIAVLIPCYNEELCIENKIDFKEPILLLNKIFECD